MSPAPGAGGAQRSFQGSPQLAEAEAEGWLLTHPALLHRGANAQLLPQIDLWDADFGFPQLLTRLPTPAASLHPPHVSAVFLSLFLTHRNRHMNMNVQASL